MLKCYAICNIILRGWHKFLNRRDAVLGGHEKNQPSSFASRIFAAQVREPGPLFGCLGDYSGKPRKTPSASTLSAKSSQSMLAIERLFSIACICDGTVRNLRPRSVNRSTTRIGWSVCETVP